MYIGEIQYIAGCRPGKLVYWPTEDALHAGTRPNRQVLKAARHIHQQDEFRLRHAESMHAIFLQKQGKMHTLSSCMFALSGLSDCLI